MQNSNTLLAPSVKPAQVSTGILNHNFRIPNTLYMPFKTIHTFQVETPRDLYLGILYSTEQHKVYGYVRYVFPAFLPII